MPELMAEQTRANLVEILSHMEDPVKLLLFTEKVQCPVCQQQQEVLEAVTALSDKLDLKIFNSQEHQEEMAKYGIDKLPATVPMGEKDWGRR